MTALGIYGTSDEISLIPISGIEFIANGGQIVALALLIQQSPRQEIELIFSLDEFPKIA
ncbi:MAG TPA: hypothetical protein VJQ59_17145 [Candidatus Sulfotelmatobacter sp.]|nr:hypothetical protein [Candidatus Sulfotelmatobacter sp.]